MARDARGFTLMEMLAGMAVAMVVGAGAVTFVRAQSVAIQTQMAQTDVNDEARAVVELMAREIRLAGYNPRCILTPPPVAALVIAEPQRIQMQADVNENGALDGGAADSEDVTYEYVSGSSKIQRVVGGVATDIATGVPAANFALRYYQSSGVEILGSAAGGALTAAERAAVYSVSILFQPTKAADPRVAVNARADLWTSVLLRNRYYPCA